MIKPGSIAMLVQSSVHPNGLNPFQAAKAWHLRKVQRLPWKANGSRRARLVVGIREGVLW